MYCIFNHLFKYQVEKTLRTQNHLSLVDAPDFTTSITLLTSSIFTSSDMELGNVSVWPRLEPFLLGALQVAPSNKLSMHYLRKMASYVRSRDGCYPRLGWLMWKHIACGKLQLSEDLAWLYFETFDLLALHTPEERLEWAEALSQCSSAKELDRQRSKVSCCQDEIQGQRNAQGKERFSL